ncbi:unnamed protein product [Hymenolepis diminuta]|uniref:Uncharacterized protein n=1 Tax=Hymenolepis diminuta TaxID=6216 RepID=A0A0R3SYX8_HYMDI|nr:unnamed protein product [Hymenolepis diminuta]VUZ40399.1 unnamed protein product [Hymenolepis diminuta]
MRSGSPKLDTVPFKVSSASGDAMQLSGAMKCEATFRGKTAAILCYVADHNINLLRLDWIGHIQRTGAENPRCNLPTSTNKRDDEAIFNRI